MVSIVIANDKDNELESRETIWNWETGMGWDGAGGV